MFELTGDSPRHRPSDKAMMDRLPWMQKMRDQALAREGRTGTARLDGPPLRRTTTGRAPRQEEHNPGGFNIVIREPSTLRTPHREDPPGFNTVIREPSTLHYPPGLRKAKTTAGPKGKTRHRDGRDSFEPKRQPRYAESLQRVYRQGGSVKPKLKLGGWAVTIGRL
jgi:hypothetical protein